ncbi:TonB-dependent siderophore receptor [Luteimonas sp. RIT-PG2_3]
MSTASASPAKRNRSRRPSIAALPLLLAIALGAGVAGAVDAADLKSAHRFEIPAQSLATALNALAKQGGVQIMSSGVNLVGRETNEIVGEYTLEQALDALLAGTELEYSVSGANTIVVRRQAQGGTSSQSPDRTLGTVEVVGVRIDDPILSSRIGDSLRERPQSVSIVTRERLDEQNLNSVASALEQTTGITVANVSFTTQEFYSRGFAISSVQVDGGAPFVFNNFGYNQLPDLAIYEQVEVLRGADALFSGNGEPGGTIQLVRKRPTANKQVELRASYGSWDNVRNELDASAPLGFDGRLRGRMVYLTEDAGSFQNVAKSSRDLVYGVLEVDVTPTTRVSLGGSFDKRKAPHGGFGLPRYADGRDLGLPRSTVLSAIWAGFDTKTSEIFASVDQNIGDRWNLRLNAMRSRQEMRNLKQYTYGSVSFNEALGRDNIEDMYGSDEQFTPIQRLVDLTLRGSFDLFGRTHNLAIGADWQDIQSGGPNWAGTYYSNIDPFNFDPWAYPQPARTRIPNSMITWGQKQNGIYVSSSFQVSDPMKILVGARYSNYQYEYGYDNFDTTTGAVTGGYYQSYEDRDILTPYAGFTYELPRNWIAYGSYSEAFQSQASYRKGPFPGESVEPKTGENLEFGIKGELMSGRAATQLAIYRIQRQNEAILDPSFPPQNTGGMSCCYLGQGTVESRGLDAEINGKLTDRWSLFAGYTFNQNEYGGGYEENGSAYMPQTPRHLFKLWTTYGFDGALEGLKIGGGATVQSDSYVSGTVVIFDPDGNAVGDPVPYRFTQGGYTVLSARAEYPLSKTWSVGLNINNLLDKTYYQTLGTSVWSNWYGAPRSFTASVRAKF